MADEEHIHDENCNHDHEHGDEDGDIEITINPREEDLASLGVSPEEFESALMATLEAYDKTIEASDPDSITPLEDAEITLGGKTYALHEVADIEISGDLESLGDEDEEGEEEEYEDEDEEYEYEDEDEEGEEEAEEEEHHN